jgi:AraC-like DNA-binding protein
MKRQRSRRASRAPKALSRLPQHAVLLAPIITSAFAELEVGASLHLDATERTFEEWYTLHVGPSPMGFEIQYGTADARWRYNQQGWERAHEQGQPVLGHHAGLHDFFVPLGLEPNGARRTLVVGPFARARPDAGDVLSQWRTMTGQHGRLGDPTFSRYLAVRIGLLTLSAAQLADLEGLLSCLARLCDPGAETDAIARAADGLRSRLLRARAAERMWDTARSMIDELTASSWLSEARSSDLLKVGVTRLPEHVVVGLLRGRSTDSEPVDDALRRDAFQRACTELALSRKGVVCARIGAYGVALLVEELAPRQVRVHELVERVATLARRFALSLHAGVSQAASGQPPAQKYEAALAAAEQALSSDVALVRAERSQHAERSTLGVLRRELREAIVRDPALLSARFQRYLTAVSVRHAYRLEPIRAQLEAAFDLITDAIESTGAFDEKSLTELRHRIEKEAVSADSLSVLSEAYRLGVADVEQALLRPQEAARVRSLRRALTYLRDHYGEPLSRARVARISGLGEHSFSRQFAESEGMTFQRYLKRLRLDRARQMLLSTTLSVEQVGKLCGFGTRVQFHKAFKQATGRTPHAFRGSERWPAA